MNASDIYQPTVANIHNAPTGRWHITPNHLPYLDERGPGYQSEREAITAARASGDYTHRIDRRGLPVKL